MTEIKQANPSVLRPGRYDAVSSDGRTTRSACIQATPQNNKVLSNSIYNSKVPSGILNEKF